MYVFVSARSAPQVLRLTGPAVSGGALLASLLARCAGLQELDLRGSAVSLDTWLAGVLEQHGARLRVLRVSLARRAPPATSMPEASTAGRKHAVGDIVRVLRVSVARRARPATRCRKLCSHQQGQCRGDDERSPASC